MAKTKPPTYAGVRATIWTERTVAPGATRAEVRFADPLPVAKGIVPTGQTDIPQALQRVQTLQLLDADGKPTAVVSGHIAADGRMVVLTDPRVL